MGQGFEVFFRRGGGGDGVVEQIWPYSEHVILSYLRHFGNVLLFVVRLQFIIFNFILKTCPVKW